MIQFPIKHHAHGSVDALKQSSLTDAIDGYIQVVGHTKVPRVMRCNVRRGSMIYIDCLNSQEQFVLIHENEISVVNSAGKLHFIDSAEEGIL
jgi:hypothetical protein